MPVPLIIPATFTAFDIVGSSAIFGGLATYFGYEAYKNSQNEETGEIPLSAPTTKSKPTSKIPELYAKTLESHEANIKKVSENIETASNEIKGYQDSKKAESDTLLQKFDKPSLLQNQVLLNDTLVNINATLGSIAIMLKAQNEIINSNGQAQTVATMGIAESQRELASNSTEMIKKADDLPFTDTQTFYDEIYKKTDDNLSINDVVDLKNQELGIIEAMQDGGSEYSEIKVALTEFRKNAIPSKKLLEVANDKAGITKPASINSSSGVGSSTAYDYTEYYKSMAKHAESAHAINEFLQTKQDVRDLDGRAITTPLGVAVAQHTPLEVKMARDLTIAREKTDINSQTVEMDDLLPSLGDSIAFIDFKPTSATLFNPDVSDEFANNMFMPEWLGVS